MVTAEIAVKRDGRVLYDLIVNYGGSTDPAYNQRLAVAVQNSMTRALVDVELPAIAHTGKVAPKGKR